MSLTFSQACVGGGQRSPSKGRGSHLSGEGSGGKCHLVAFCLYFLTDINSKVMKSREKPFEFLFWSWFHNYIKACLTRLTIFLSFGPTTLSISMSGCHHHHPLLHPFLPAGLKLGSPLRSDVLVSTPQATGYHHSIFWLHKCDNSIHTIKEDHKILIHLLLAYSTKKDVFDVHAWECPPEPPSLLGFKDTPPCAWSVARYTLLIYSLIMVDVWVASTSWLTWIMMLSTWVNK